MSTAPMLSLESKYPPFAPVLIHLLKGVVNYDDEAVWTLLLRHRKEIGTYFAQIGLHVHVSEGEGFAFLQGEKEAEDEGLPRLTSRHPLNYQTTLLCVLLRERLLQHDTGDIDSPRLVASHEELHEAMRPFFTEQTDDTRLIDKIDRAINRVKDMGFLTPLSTSDAEKVYEVRRILKAKISAEMLESIKEKLENHAITSH
ncbi:MAG: DUF4194 domain-containing protein [Rhodothermales bacterium]